MGKVERGILNHSGYETWMQRRERDFHDEVDPLHVDEIDGCHVVWARREGIAETGPFNLCHIGCDHLGIVQHGESELEAVFSCTSVHKYLIKAAVATASETFGVDKIIPPFLHTEEDGVHLDEEGEMIAGNFVFEALARTIEEPERCQGNIRDGFHMKPILSFMLGGVAESQMDEILAQMEFNNIIRHDDPFVKIAELAD